MAREQQPQLAQGTENLELRMEGGADMAVSQNRTTIKTAIACSGKPQGGGGYDGDNCVLHYSFGFSDMDPVDIEVPLNKGDTTQEVAERVEKEMAKKVADSRYKVSSKGSESKTKGKGSPTGRPGTSFVDDFSLTVDDASHVDAGVNDRQGKITFSGDTYNSGPGGVKVQPPPPPPKGTKWKKELEKEGDSRGLTRHRLARGEHLPPLHSAGPHRWPGDPGLRPVTDPIPGGRRRSGGTGIGVLVLGSKDRSMGESNSDEMLIVPFEYRYESPQEQVSEFMTRLEAAGVSCAEVDGAIYPEALPNGDGIRMFGFIESNGLFMPQLRFPWHWVVLPHVVRTGRSVSTVTRVFHDTPERGAVMRSVMTRDVQVTRGGGAERGVSDNAEIAQKMRTE